MFKKIENMTPQEKAKELVDSFKRLSQKKCDCLEYSCTCFKVYTHQAKRMTLITANELIKSSPARSPINDSSDFMPHFKAVIFWQEVKTEIEKL